MLLIKFLAFYGPRFPPITPSPSSSPPKGLGYINSDIMAFGGTKFSVITQSHPHGFRSDNVLLDNDPVIPPSLARVSTKNFQLITINPPRPDVIEEYDIESEVEDRVEEKRL